MRGLVSIAIALLGLASIRCQSTDAISRTAAEIGVESIARRYHGYAKLTHRMTRMPVVLDLVKDPDKNDNYRGFVRVAAGGFDSHEYVTAYFAAIHFEAPTSNLVFGGGSDDFQIVDAKLEGHFLRATIEVPGEHVTLPLELTVDDGGDAVGFDGLPIAGHLTGHYVADCYGQRESLQLEASRWRGKRGTDTTSFGGYRVFGRHGKFDEFMCGDKNQACVSDTYPDVKVQFFARTLQLSAKSNDSCDITGTSIACGDVCSFVKDTGTPHTVLDTAGDERQHPRAFHIPSAAAAAAIDSGLGQTQEPKGRAGQYYGYVHHEGRDTYQLLALNVRSAPEIDIATGAAKSGEFVTAVATLYFGEGDSSEFVAYRFKEAIAPAAGGPLVFEGDGEAIFVIDNWQGPSIQGTWYGKAFGRIGTVELTKNLVPPLGQGASIVQRLTGHYQGEGWEFEMAVSANLSEQTSDFYPLKIYGWARERLNNARRRTIEDGVFDFYTGAIAFKLDDGRTVLGRMTTQGMELHWAPLPRLGSPVTTADFRAFQRISDVLVPQAMLPRTKSIR